MPSLSYREPAHVSRELLGFSRFVLGIICASDRGILSQRHSLHRSTPDTYSFSIFVSVAKRYIQFRISLFWCSILIQPSYVTATFDVRCRDLIVLCCTRCIFRKSHFGLGSEMLQHSLFPPSVAFNHESRLFDIKVSDSISNFTFPILVSLE